MIVVGHLNGAKKFVELKNLVKKIFMICLIISVLIASLLFIFNSHIVSLFTSDLLVMEEVENILIFIILTLLVYPLMTICSYTFIGIKKSHYALYFIVLNFILVIAFIFLFNVLFDFNALSVRLAIAVSDLIETLYMAFILQRDISLKIKSSGVECVS